MIHNIHISKIKGLFLFFLILGTYYLSPKVALGQTTLPLQVSPARQEIQLSPGEDGAVNVKFFNLTDTSMAGVVKVADFMVSDADGSPRIIDDISQASPRFAASNWVSIPYDKIALAKNDVLTIQAKIRVPQNARPGGRYVAIYFEPSVNTGQQINTTGNAALGITPRIASLIFVRVKGPITEQALASKFFATSFQEYGPITVTTEILNRGDYHIRPRGVLTMSNMFDGLVDQSKLEEKNIFPDASREFKNTFGTKWMFGRYKVNLVTSYGDTGRAISKSLYVYVLPWKLLLIILIALILLILFTRHFYQNLIVKQRALGEQVQKESSEIERLKEQLRSKDE